jgi:thiamine kinase-like enzyme
VNVATPVPAWLTADWLTDVLQRSGDLTGGRVDSFAIESARSTVISNVGRIRPVYSPTSHAGPRSLFFKTLREDVGVALLRGNRREAEFYASAAPLTPAGLLPRCYDATFLDDGPVFHLLLEDLSDTHFVISQWPLPPTVAQCEQILQTYARFHAFWWDHPQLGTSVGRLRGPLEEKSLVEEYERRFALFADSLGDRLSPQRRRRYERAIAAGGRLMERRRLDRNRTLVQGDAHVWNLLYPLDGTSGSIRLIDWDSWRIDTPTDDLAYMMALHWYPERRALLERRLLECYHKALVNAGVAGYDFDALWEDYRLSVVWQLTIPVWQCSLKFGAWIWWGHLERVMLAFEDLGCAELLG